MACPVTPVSRCQETRRSPAHSTRLMRTSPSTAAAATITTLPAPASPKLFPCTVTSSSTTTNASAASPGLFAIAPLPGTNFKKSLLQDLTQPVFQLLRRHVRHLAGALITRVALQERQMHVPRGPVALLRDQ